MHAELIDRESIRSLLLNILRGVYRFEQFEVHKFGLTFQQIYLLKFLNGNTELTISKIAQEMRMKLFSATRLVDQLEEKSLIERKRSKTDKRSVLVTLVKKGQRLIKKIDDATLDTILSNITRFSEEEIKAFLLTSEYIEAILDVETQDGTK